jgi:Zn-dependent protease with chaperone function
MPFSYPMNRVGQSFLQLFCVGCLVFHSYVSLGQFDKDYIPRKSSSEASSGLIRQSKLFLQQKIKSIKSPVLKRLYTSRTHALISSIKSGAIMQDDSLQQFVDEILHKLLTSNAMSGNEIRVLVLRNPLPNAFCYGEGTLMVTVGLLSRIENESQLAFALAHELAHHELDHITLRLEEEVAKKLARRTRQEITKIMNGEISLENIEEFKKLIYDASQYSREMERQADSLGFALFRNAGYNQKEAVTMLTLLDSAEVPKRKLGARLFNAFNFSKYTFDPAWLKPRLSIYSERPTHTFFLSIDSLQSHPDIALRKTALRHMLGNDQAPLNYQPSGFVSSVIAIADFEVIESAFYTRQYDRCIHQALQLLSLYPDNAYLIGKIARVLIVLHEATMNHAFELFVPQYTFYYHEEARKVNNFLYNLSPAEIAELAYHFLNNEGNFKEDHEEHYFLLWRISALTHRNNVQAKIKEVYRTRYPKGMFLSKMR